MFATENNFDKELKTLSTLIDWFSRTWMSHEREIIEQAYWLCLHTVIGDLWHNVECADFVGPEDPFFMTMEEKKQVFFNMWETANDEEKEDLLKKLKHTIYATWCFNWMWLSDDE